MKSSMVALLACLVVPAAPVEPLTARNYLQKMSPGINLGNTLEAIPKETSWGNPLTADAKQKRLPIGSRERF